MQGKCRQETVLFYSVLTPQVLIGPFKSALKQMTSFYGEIPKIQKQHDDLKIVNGKNFRDMDSKLIQLERTISMNNQSISDLRSQKKFAFRRVIDCEGSDNRCLAGKKFKNLLLKSEHAKGYLMDNLPNLQLFRLRRDPNFGKKSSAKAKRTHFFF